MTRYADLDTAILRDIRAGLDTLSQFDHSLWVANQIAGKDRAGWPLGEALLARRLQSLRKSGRIRFERGRWVALSQTEWNLKYGTA